MDRWHCDNYLDPIRRMETGTSAGGGSDVVNVDEWIGAFGTMPRR